YISKVNTAAQIIFAAAVLADLAFGIGMGAVRDWLAIIVGVLTVASAGAYLVDWVRHMAQD
ncbi:MAG: CDP-alcohol phosphatidyltransferase family protein, partial [Bauldia sp.]